MPKTKQRPGTGEIETHWGHVSILTEHIHDHGDGTYTWDFLFTPGRRHYKVKASSVEQAVRLAALSIRTREALWLRDAQR
jgi:hypothetical protein